MNTVNISDRSTHMATLTIPVQTTTIFRKILETTTSIIPTTIVNKIETTTTQTNEGIPVGQEVVEILGFVLFIIVETTVLIWYYRRKLRERNRIIAGNPPIYS